MASLNTVSDNYNHINNMPAQLSASSAADTVYKVATALAVLLLLGSFAPFL